MPVRVRLTRVGSKKNAIWRVVVADGRSPRDGRFIEMIGHYNPQTEPSQIVIDKDRLQHWLDRGAQPSNTVRKLMRAETSGGGAATAVAEEPPAAGAPEEPAADGDAPAGADAEGAAGAAAGAVEPAEQPDADSADAAPESGAESG